MPIPTIEEMLAFVAALSDEEIAEIIGSPVSSRPKKKPSTRRSPSVKLSPEEKEIYKQRMKELKKLSPEAISKLVSALQSQPAGMSDLERAAATMKLQQQEGEGK